jgi:hypothetical protein
MTVVGFNLNKILVEKKKPIKGKVNISNNVKITNAEEQALSLGKTKEKGLKFSFEFSSKYEPEIGEITLVGDIVSIEDEKKVKEITAAWKKDKKLGPDLMTGLLNTVLAKCNIKALILSQEINLPPPIPMPKVKKAAAK